MITIKVSGGLGNQLFQYALGYALKRRLNKQVQFDTSFFDTPGQDGATDRALHIEVFNLTAFKRKPSKETLPKKDIVSKLRRLIERNFLPYYKQSYVLEQSVIYDAHIFDITDDAYLDGYWQSIEYLRGIEADLHSQFTLKDGWSESALRISNLISQSVNSVSMHVRRGDYISKYSHIYYSQPINYYKEALNYIQHKLKTRHTNIFVFSDDIDWCQENLEFNCPVNWVHNKGMYVYEDMLLMGQCMNQIIANSTYSWWGAWLNKFENKLVIAPETWYINPEKNTLFTQSIYPSSWIRL